MKYINLTSINLKMSSAITEIPAAPPATSTLSLGISSIPSTPALDQQNSGENSSPPTTTIENNPEYKEYCKNLMKFDSVLFTRSSVN
jgi:hypothetical protein